MGLAHREALQVMRRNPAVLQCGPSLELLGPGEIKGFAALRGAGNTLLPPAARPALLAALGAAILLALAVERAPSPAPELVALLDVVRPLLGAVLGGSFLFSAWAAAKSS